MCYFVTQLEHKKFMRPKFPRDRDEEEISLKKSQTLKSSAFFFVGKMHKKVFAYFPSSSLPFLSFNHLMQYLLLTCESGNNVVAVEICFFYQLHSQCTILIKEKFEIKFLNFRHPQWSQEYFLLNSKCASHSSSHLN